MAVKKKVKKKVKAKSSRIQFGFVCDEDLRDAFIDTCSDMDTSASRELRAYMRKYVAKHGQQFLL